MLTVRGQANDGAQYTGAVQQAVLPVVGAAVRIAQGYDFLLFTGPGIQLEDLIDGFIADPEVAGRIPNRAFSKTETTSYLGHLRFAVEKTPKPGLHSLQGRRSRVCLQPGYRQKK